MNDSNKTPPTASEDTDNKRGIYRKYDVTRLNDPTGKHRECEYFVLDFKHDKYAFVALQAYAQACREEFPELASDLLRRSVGERSDELSRTTPRTSEAVPAFDEKTIRACSDLCLQVKARHKERMGYFMSLRSDPMGKSGRQLTEASAEFECAGECSDYILSLLDPNGIGHDDLSRPSRPQAAEPRTNEVQRIEDQRIALERAHAEGYDEGKLAHEKRPETAKLADNFKKLMTVAADLVAPDTYMNCHWCAHDVLACDCPLAAMRTVVQDIEGPPTGSTE